MLALLVSFWLEGRSAPRSVSSTIRLSIVLRRVLHIGAISLKVSLS